MFKSEIKSKEGAREKENKIQGAKQREIKS